MPTSVLVSPHETSTIVRSYGIRWRQRLVLAGVGSLSHVAPGAAAWAGGAPLPDSAATPCARARARSPGARAAWHRSRRWAATRDMDLGSRAANPPRPRLGREGGPAGRVRRAAGRERLLGRVVRRTRSRRLGGTPRHDSRDGASPSAAWSPRSARCAGSSRTRGAASSAAGPSAGGSSTASSICRRRSRSSRRRPTSAATSSRFADACGLTAGARGRLDRRLTARVGAPSEALDLSRFAADLPRASARRPRPGGRRGAVGGGGGDRRRLAGGRARDHARPRASTDPSGPGGRRARHVIPDRTPRPGLALRRGGRGPRHALLRARGARRYARARGLGAKWRVSAGR